MLNRILLLCILVTFSFSYAQKNAEDLYNEALKFKMIGKTEDALSSLNKAIEIDPQLIEAYYERALIKGNKEDYEGAIDDLIKVSYSDDEDIRYEANMLMADAYMKLGKFAMVQFCLSDAYKIRDDDPSLFYMRGIMNREAGLAKGNEKWIRSGIEDFNRVIELGDSSAYVYADRGLAFAYLEDFNNASSDFTTAISKAPGDVRFIQERGMIYLHMNEFEKAIKDFQFVLKLNPIDSYAFLQIGIAQKMLNNLDAACEAWKEAIDLGNGEAQNYFETHCIE